MIKARQPWIGGANHKAKWIELRQNMLTVARWHANANEHAGPSISRWRTEMGKDSIFQINSSDLSPEMFWENPTPLSVLLRVTISLSLPRPRPLLFVWMPWSPGRNCKHIKLKSFAISLKLTAIKSHFHVAVLAPMTENSGARADIPSYRAGLAWVAATVGFRFPHLPL